MLSEGLRKGKSLSKKTKPKGSGEQTLNKLKGLLLDTQAQLQQSLKLNHLYLSQIQSLEQDNLALCVRLQQVKTECQRSIRDLIQDRERESIQIQDLLQVVTHLQNEIHKWKEEGFHLRAEREEIQTEWNGLKENAALGQQARIQAGELAAQLQRYKLKVLQSQRYWMTRCDTLLMEKQNQYERVLVERQSEFSQKIRMLNNTLEIRQRELLQKTTEIYKLIAHIQNVGSI